MLYINRLAAVVKPKIAFLEWANGLPDAGDVVITLDQLGKDCQVFLIPEFPDEKKALAYVNTIHSGIFEMELESICTDEACWPRKRDWKMFLKWFDVEIHSIVINATDDPIEYEE